MIRKALQDWSRKRLWAIMAKEEAVKLGHEGQMEFDSRRNVLVFDGMGELAMDELADRLPGLTMEQQAKALNRKVGWFMQYHHPIPDDWVVEDQMLRRKLSNVLWSVAGDPSNPSPHEELARLGKLVGREGWRDELGVAAELYAERGRTVRPALTSARLYWELGDEDRSTRSAREFLDLKYPDRSPDTVRHTDAASYLLAVALADGRQGVNAESGAFGDLDGNELSRTLIDASKAIEDGDTAMLEDAVSTARRWKARMDRDRDDLHLWPDSDWSIVAALIEGWIEESDMVSIPSPEPAPTVSRTDIVDGGAVDALRWAGEVLEGRRSDSWSTLSELSSPAGGPESIQVPADSIESRPGRVLLTDQDGRSVVLYEEDPEEWNDLDYRWSPDHGRIVLFSDHGPMIVVDRDGEMIGTFVGHEDGPNLGAALTEDWLVSWAADGQVAVHDLARQRLHTAVRIDAWPEDAALDASGRLLAVSHPDDGWLVFVVESGSQIGPTTPARIAAWHGRLPVLAFADETAVWLEWYEESN